MPARATILPKSVKNGVQDTEGECNIVTAIVSYAVVIVFASVYNCYLGVLQPYPEYADGNDIQQQYSPSLNST